MKEPGRNSIISQVDEFDRIFIDQLSILRKLMARGDDTRVFDESFAETVINTLGLFEDRIDREITSLREKIRKLENAFDIAEKQQGEYLMLLDMGRLLLDQTDLDSLLRLAMDMVLQVTGAERGFLVVKQPDGKLTEIVSRRSAGEFPLEEEESASRNIVTSVMDSGESLVITDALDDNHLSGKSSIQRFKLRSILAVPLKLEQSDEIIGAFSVDSSKVSGLFDSHSINKFEKFASQIASAIRNASLIKRLEEHNRALTAELGEDSFRGIVAVSEPMRQVIETARLVSKSNAPVLLVGESGTGKELLAKAIHQASPRGTSPFLCLNCAAIPEQLLESELFGFEKGAFTGADTAKKGKFEIAHSGTLFLDEIGDMPPVLQAKILRVLQDGVVERLGGTKPVHTDVRIIAATNRNLEEMRRAGTFREDLYYRLNVVQIAVPPLRERKEDILPLTGQFITRFAVKMEIEQPKTSGGLLDHLLHHSYPGNVRELKNIIQRAIILAGGGELTVSHLPEGLDAMADRIETETRIPRTGSELAEMKAVARRNVARQLETMFLRDALKRAEGNVTRAAAETEMNRTQFHKLMKKLNIDRHEKSRIP